MPKSKDVSLTDRNRTIREMRDEGRTIQAIADTMDLSKARVSQILEEMDDEISVGGYRAFLASQGELALREVRKILLEDPDPIVSAGGKVMYHPDPDDPSGKTPDLTRPILNKAIKLDAAKTMSPLLDRLSKLRGADARPPKELVDEGEVREEIAYVQKVINDRQKLTDILIKYGIEVPPLSPYEGFYEAEVIESPEDSPR